MEKSECAEGYGGVFLSSYAAVRKHTGLINDNSHNSSLCILYPLLARCQLTLREAEVYRV